MQLRFQHARLPDQAAQGVLGLFSPPAPAHAHRRVDDVSDEVDAGVLCISIRSKAGVVRRNRE